MSYLTKIGSDVDKSIEQSEKDYTKALKSFKSGTTYKVRLLGLADRAEYYAHSAFKVFYTTVHTADDYYCAARKLLFDDANKETDETKKNAILEKAKMLRPQPRYLFGFASISGETTGEQIVLDLTKAQAKNIINAINKNAKKINNKWFELEKTGSSTNTTVSFTPMDLEDLTDAEMKAFESFEGQSFDTEIFGNVFTPNSPEQQLQDLEKLGFDISRLTGNGQAQANEEQYDF